MTKNIKIANLPKEQWADDVVDLRSAKERFMESVQEGLDGSERMLVFYIKLDGRGGERKYTTCFHDIRKDPAARVSEPEMLALLQREINKRLADG